MKRIKLLVIRKIILKDKVKLILNNILLQLMSENIVRKSMEYVKMKNIQDTGK